MATKTQVQIELQPETLKLFDRYHKYTGTSPEFYITELVEKTLPTIKAMVEAMDEASQNPEADIDVMELFARNMASAALDQKNAAKDEPITL